MCAGFDDVEVKAGFVLNIVRMVNWVDAGQSDASEIRICALASSDLFAAIRATAVLRRFRGAPVLTIGNGPGFLEAGGMFELLVEDRKVLFDVSLPPIQESHLDVSARLLRLAKSRRR